MINPANVALIADSGSTKTAWCLTSNPQNIIYTQGINPYQQNEEEICAILQHELMPKLSTVNCHWLSVYFYGAGCTPEKSPMVASTLRQVIGTSGVIRVESDMLGAARGLCGRQPGIVAILGTGSNSCYYDGRDLHPGIPALGYILGDEGSGAYIGKRLVGDIFKKQLPDDICKLFFEETHETQANIIQRVYRTPLPNRYLASFSPFCSRHRGHPAIHAFLLDCFDQFFQRNILPLKPKLSTLNPKPTTIHFVGSIALYYKQELSEAAARYGFSVGTVLQSPLEGMLAYHQNA